MDSNVDHDALTSQFINATGANIEQATEYLSASNWDLTVAAQSYFADEDDHATAATSGAAAASSSAAPPEYTGPRTLDGRPAPQAIPTTSGSSSSKRPQQKKKGLATLSSIGGGGAHDDDDDDDDHDDDDADHRDTYAGGEKSGLAVQDPNQRADPRRIINDLLSKAKSNARRPETSAPAGPSSSSSFRGSGQTLGGEGEESRVIPDPHGPSSHSQAQNTETQTRILHLWQDGFSVDDGELHRFDDPRNAEDLRMIQSGRAPIHLMNVRYGEPIDVKLQQHNEKYRPLPKVYKPFGGEGRRLGSPVPGDATASPATIASTSAPSNSGTAASSSAGPTNPTIDESQPTVTIRIQMPDGTRLPARFNTSQTVNDIYEFISRASAELQNPGWVLATTFPNKDHTDKSLVIGEMNEFKRGGTAVVKKTT